MYVKTLITNKMNTDRLLSWTTGIKSYIMSANSSLIVDGAYPHDSMQPHQHLQCLNELRDKTVEIKLITDLDIITLEEAEAIVGGISLEPTKPTKPEEPVEPTKPTTPTKPEEPVEPAEPTTPTTPTKPVSLIQPTEQQLILKDIETEDLLPPVKKMFSEDVIVEPATVTLTDTVVPKTGTVVKEDKAPVKRRARSRSKSKK